MKPDYSHLSAKQPIGIFDSGVGGLTVAKEIKRLMPHEDLIYFGDTKHLPYGEKSKEAIVGYSLRIVEFLLSLNCKAIVIACNTATANALKEILELVDGRVPVFDVINPVAEKVILEMMQVFGNFHGRSPRIYDDGFIFINQGCCHSSNRPLLLIIKASLLLPAHHYHPLLTEYEWLHPES